MAAFLGGDANTYYLDSPSLITTLESELGRSFAGFRMNYWPNDQNDPRGYLDPVFTTYYNAGRKWVYLNGKPNPISSDGTYMQWSTVASGGYDAYLTWWFNKLKADTRWDAANPLHVSFHHEQYVTAEGGGSLAGTPASYAKAFQHVRSIMDSTGAHVSKGGNCLMCFVPHWLQLQNDPVYSSTVNTSSTSYTYRVSVIDPGPAYYDICGFDCYKSTNQASTTSMSSMWTPFHKWAVAAGKPMITGEWGINHFSDSQIQTDLAALLTLLKSYGSGAGAGQLLMMTTTHRLAGQGDYRWDINPTVLAAYKNFANDPFFAATVGSGGGGGGVTAPTSGAPTIDDTSPQTLEVIHALANDSSWDGTKPLDYSAQWQQAASAAGPWTNITTGTSTTSFTADTYSVPTGVAGQVLRARVTGSNLAAGGGALTVNTAATSSVSTAPTPPTNSSPPVLSDATPTVGDLLTATTGTWANSPASYSGQWQTAASNTGPWSAANGANVSQSIFPGDTYHVVSTDQARFLRCLVTAVNGAGSSAPAASAATAAVAAPTVIVTDTITTADGQHINEGQDYTVVWTASTNAPLGITSSQASLDGGAFVDGVKVADDGAGGGTWQITFTAPPAGTHTVVTRDIA